MFPLVTVVVTLERCRSIVMSTSVCLSVCPRAYLPNHTRDLYQVFVNVAYRRGSVLLRRNHKGSLGQTDNALYSIAFGTHTKKAEPIEMPFGIMTRVRLRYHVLDGRPDAPRGRGNFWGLLRVPGHSKALAIFAAPVAFADHSIANKRHAAEAITQYARQAQIVF